MTNYTNSPEFYKFLEKFDDERIRIVTAAEIKAIRKSYNLSQSCFSKMLNISVKTLQNYEISRTKPSITASSFFIFARDNIKLFQKKYLPKIGNIQSFRESMN